MEKLYRAKIDENSKTYATTYRNEIIESTDPCKVAEAVSYHYRTSGAHLFVKNKNGKFIRETDKDIIRQFDELIWSEYCCYMCH